MVKTESLLADRQRALVKWLGIGVVALIAVKHGEVVEAYGDIGMVRATRSFADRQRVLVFKDGFMRTVEGAKRVCQAAVRLGEIRLDRQRSLEMRDHLTKIGIEPIITTPQEFADIIADEIPKWAAIVRATGIRIAE